MRATIFLISMLAFGCSKPVEAQVFDLRTEKVRIILSGILDDYDVRIDTLPAQSTSQEIAEESRPDEVIRTYHNPKRRWLFNRSSKDTPVLRRHLQTKHGFSADEIDALPQGRAAILHSAIHEAERNGYSINNGKIVKGTMIKIESPRFRLQINKCANGKCRK